MNCPAFGQFIFSGGVNMMTIEIILEKVTADVGEIAVADTKATT